jgi:hypothetical protein
MMYRSQENPNLEWLLSINPRISRIFEEEHSFAKRFQSFLERVIRDLRERGNYRAGDARA